LADSYRAKLRPASARTTFVEHLYFDPSVLGGVLAKIKTFQ